MSISTHSVLYTIQYAFMSACFRSTFSTHQFYKNVVQFFFFITFFYNRRSSTRKPPKRPLWGGIPIFGGVNRGVENPVCAFVHSDPAQPRKNRCVGGNKHQQTIYHSVHIHVCVFPVCVFSCLQFKHIQNTFKHMYLFLI